MLVVIFIKMSLTFKILQVLLASALKFIVAPLAAKELDFQYYQTLILTIIGGICGMIFFYYLTTAIIKIYRYLLRKLKNAFRTREAIAVRKIRKKSKVFTRRNRFIVWLRGKYGMFGIVALSPLLSLAVGSFLANKYYSKNKNILLYLSISVVTWSVIFTSIYYLIF
jgi:hypothetical protein